MKGRVLAGIVLAAMQAAAVSGQDPPPAQQSEQPLGQQLAEAEAGLRNGDVTGVIERLRVLQDRFPHDVAVRALLGRALVLDREFAAAEPLLAAAVAGGQADLGTQLTLAAVLWENGRLEESERLYRAAAGRSDDPAAVYPLAKLLLWRGKAEEAALLLEQVIASRPAWPEARLDYARALEQGDRPARALEQVSIFLESAPEHAEALYTQATLYRQLGRADEAAATLERFARAQADDRRHTLATGRYKVALDAVRADLENGDGAAALSKLNTLPEDADTLRLAARAFELDGRATEALRALERAVATDPSRADIRVELQDAYRRLGNGG